MAHDTAAHPDRHRLLALGAVLALAAAAAVAFGRVFTGGNAVGKLVLVAIASALVAAVLERRNLLLSTVLSAAALLVVIGLLVFPHTTLWGLPTAETLRSIRDAAADVGRQADAQIAPTPPLPPLYLAAVAALWAAVFSAHALAIRAGSPLLAVLPPVALVAFADTVLDETQRPLYGVLFLGAVLAVVFLDGLRRVQAWGPVWAWPGSRGHAGFGWSPTGRGARRVAALALGVATIVPLTLPGFGTGSVIDLSGGSSGETVRLNPLVSIRSSLTQDEAVELFQVRSAAPSYWRTLALDRFDGLSWSASEDPTEPITDGTPLALLQPGSQRFDQEVAVGEKDAALIGVPVAFPATRVSYPGDLSYDRELQTLSVEGGILPAGTRYSVQSYPATPTPTQLAAAVFPDTGPDTRYTSLPSDLPALPEIRGIALDWTDGARSSYEAVLAIQDRLHDGFTYDDTVPARDDSFTLLDFLRTTQRGFCQQFASAMAVMLRSLGIPARVAVGFTQGFQLPDQPGVWHITNRQYHSWVEVLFPTYGWLAFEPTPTRFNPVAEAYDAPLTRCVNADGTPCAGGGNTPTENGGQQTELQRLNLERRGTPKGGNVRAPLPPDPFGAGAVAAARRFPTGWVVGALGLATLLVLLVIPPARALRRRRRLRRAGRDPRTMILATYDVFDARAADVGWGRRAGETLRQYQRRVGDAGVLRDGDLERLASLTARAAYAGAEPGTGDAREASRAAEATLRDLRREVGLGTRIVGMYRPERWIRSRSPSGPPPRAGP